MVFSSLPLYLDPPNWTQQEANQDRSGGGGSGGSARGDCEHLPQGVMVPHSETAGISACSIRPSSMAERARLAKIPLPEPSLKCPRCDSTNTKFCYFNNYSLSQPRHFCKTCRRYWTRGGSLRNVPVGGGCRRNKRNKAGASSSSKPSATTANSTAASSSLSSTPTSGGLLPSNLFSPLHLPFMPSFHPMVDYGSTNLGLNFSGIQPIDTVDYQAGTSSSVGLEQWRFQQFPFLGGFDLQPSPQATSPMGQFPFDAEVVGADGFGHQVIPRVSCSGLITQFASVKMEDSNPQRLSLSRQYSGSNGNDHYWGGGGGGNTGNHGGCAGWPVDLSGFNSSS